jgi:hypothetical protein
MEFLGDQKISVEEKPDAFDKLFEDAQIASALNHPRGHALLEAFHASAAQRDQIVEAHYTKLAASAEKKSAGATLEKRAGKVARVEETMYPSGAKVIAELDANNVVIRTYAVEP